MDDDEPQPDLHAGGATMLPSAQPTRPRRPPGFWITLAVVLVLLVAAIVLPLALRGSKSGPTQPAAAARVSGQVPQTAVFAESNHEVAADPAAVVAEARALLSGTLPAATLSSSARAALVSPPAAGGGSAMLGAALALDDPALPGCLASITEGAALFGLDRISYAGTPALLMVTADGSSVTQASGYVIGQGCATPGSGIRTFVTVPLTG